MTMARITPHGLQNTVDALVRDVSTEGIGVYARGHYEKGETLLVKVSIKTDQGEVITGSLIGRVAWVTPVEDRKERAVGIELLDLEKKNPRLYAYLEKLEQVQSEKP